MVINGDVTTAEARGDDMLLRLLCHAHPGSRIFLIIMLQLRCLAHSPAVSLVGLVPFRPHQGAQQQAAQFKRHGPAARLIPITISKQSSLLLLDPILLLGTATNAAYSF